jgi:hypothetical protein
MGMDLDGLLPFLEARNKVRIKSGVVYPDSSAACDHYDADLVELPAANQNGSSPANSIPSHRKSRRIGIGT